MLTSSRHDEPKDHKGLDSQNNPDQPLGKAAKAGLSRDSIHRSGIPLPPLFYKAHERDDDGRTESQEHPFGSATKAKNTPVATVTPDKTPPILTQLPTLPTKNSFLPIDRPPIAPIKKSSIHTPPASPFTSKQLFPSTVSPTPSLWSLAPTEDTTEHSLTPCSPSPSTAPRSYLRAASYSPHQQDSVSNQNYRHSFALDTCGLVSPKPCPAYNSYNVAPTTPRKSPIKYGRHRFSPTSSFSPYSPSGNSIGSHSSTSAPDEAARKQRVKTEMCMHYSRGRVCPFGVNCTYAHGEEELQMTKLMDLQRAGLIDDVDVYRTKPCFTHVATGSCPFGKRCASIHDTRITSSISSWLPHTETQGNSISTDINVDGLHQKRQHEILQGNPFGDQFSLELDDFPELYKLICNTTTNNKRRRNNLSEIHKLSIALQMRGNPGWMYKYRPQHIIFNELCMVLHKRAFRLEASGRAIPITIATYNSKNKEHVMVREIAFGPDSDSTVRGVSLWFNIPENEVTECTAKQAKRYRWKKTPKFDDQRALDARPSVFDSRECFTMIRPFDKSAFNFATEILNHRYQTVHAERCSSLSDRFDALKKLQINKGNLQERFASHKHHWLKWAWPINTGRQYIDEQTKVPPVDAEYNPLLDNASMVRAQLADSHNGAHAVQGSAIQAIWKSFVSVDFENLENPISLVATTQLRPRLSIFSELAQGKPVCDDRSLPHIHRSEHRLTSTWNKCSWRSGNENLNRESERCWKALLLEPASTEAHRQANEWEIVRDHFQNARCKKVLTIIQQ